VFPPPADFPSSGKQIAVRLANAFLMLLNCLRDPRGQIGLSLGIE
jgi:hypothetical protein